MQYLKWFYMMVVFFSILGGVSLLFAGALTFWEALAVFSYVLGAYLIEKKEN